MNTNLEFAEFTDQQEQLDYLHQYKLLAPTKNEIPQYFYRSKSSLLPCRIIGHINYDTFSIVVVDFGEGPHFIHSDYFREMQKGTSSLPANPVTNAPVNRPKRTERPQKGKCLSKLPDSYVIFDLETTDLNIYRAEIIQIAAMRIRGGEIIDTFCSYVKPENPIPKSITKLTGITELDVYCAPDIQTVLPQFLDYIGEDCLAGYNIHSYDTNILYDIMELCLNTSLANDYFDFYLFFKSSLNEKDVGSYKLTAIAEYYDIDTKDAHDALADCKLCYECYRCFSESHGNVLISPQNINNIHTDFEKQLLLRLQALITSEALPESSLYLYSNRSNKGGGKNIEMSKSICIHEPDYPPNPNSKDIIGKNYVVLKFLQEKEMIKLIIRKSQYEMIAHSFADVTITEKKDEIHLSFSETHTCIIDYMMENVLYCLKHYRSSASFSCCSQFVACSDALKCIHENKLYATGCAYRHNLENGKIFYGKNKNYEV